MKKILIDGSFIGKRVTGVQRFCWETLRELVKIPGLSVYVAVPECIDTENELLSGVKIIRYGKKNNKRWQLFTLKKIAKKHGLPLLCMANFSPLFRKDYLVLHDVTFLDKQGRNRFLWALAYRILVGYRIRKHKKIFTVSEFSKSRILYHYKKLKDGQVVVVGNGGGCWTGNTEKKPDFITDEAYYLAVGSTTPNKNFEYIIALAKRYPAKRFLVVGRLDDSYAQRVSALPNITFTGYLSNEELFYLYHHCVGLILPSVYEGFGLPPLEALNCGCRTLILSDIPVFREVYGKVGNFLDPYDFEHLIDLDGLKQADEASAQEVMEKYCWKNVAKIIYENLEES